MKRTISYVTVILCMLVYYCADNPKWFEAYTDYRENRKYLGYDKYRYGDLFGLSYLSAYKAPKRYAPRMISNKTKRDINLFLFCDSYLHNKIHCFNFTRVDSLFYLRWWSDRTNICLARLDPSKRNVIVIEVTERFMRSIGQNPQWLYGMLKLDPSCNQHKERNTGNESYASFSDVRLVNPDINSNLEFNLFDYPLFTRIKQWKADFNYYVFNRVNSDVYVDVRKEQLYYVPTISPDQNMSSFMPLDSSEAGKITAGFNQVYRHYRYLGFDEVYLSVIPNPVTCIHPDLMPYNGLIPKIYNSDSLQIPVINVYDLFLTKPRVYYLSNDTHWSNAGMQTWLDVTDSCLNKIKQIP